MSSKAAGSERKRIGDILVADGILTAGQLGQALAAQAEDPSRPRLGQLVIELEMVSETAVARALARQLGLRMIDLNERLPEQAALDAVPRRLAERHCALPLEIDTDSSTLTVVMADPTDVFALDDLRAQTRMRTTKVLVGPESAVRSAIQRGYDADSAASKVVQKLGGAADVETVDDFDVDLAAEGEADEPVIALVNALLADAVRGRTSDVHVEPGRTGLRVRYRIDGLLREVQTIPKRMTTAVASRFKIMSSLDIAERRRPQDGRAMIRVGDNEVDLRVSTMPTMHGEKIVLRLLRKGTERIGIDVLGLSEDQRATFDDSLSRTQGLILMTGPTGSGKTTSLYAGLAAKVSPEINIVTLEDPVEYQLGGVNQSQMNSRIGLTFASGLRTVLRQDPDVVMVGEIRDTETAQLAVEASFTGHLVLSTLHTNDSPSTVARLVELGVERFLLATTLQLVVAQRLGRRVCDDCAEPAPPPEDRVLEQLGLDRAALEGAELRVGAGCTVCDETGYVGRVGFYEMLRMTPRLRQLVSDGGNELQIGALARAQGMRSLRQDGIGKALDGITTLEEVVRTTPEDQFRTEAVDGGSATELAVRVGAVVQPRALVAAGEHEAKELVDALPEGWQHTVAHDIDEVLERAASSSPDVIVMATVVDGFPAVAVAERLRRVVDGDVHVVLRTPTELDAQTAEDATLVGIDDVVVTPDGRLEALTTLLAAVLPGG